ncbi:MAG TPA: glycosyltransferase family 39 protein [Anaerolineales bacterium]|nr:glycosyltransferase family 39 protein [Anaerolineales bacterium]
MKNKVWFFGSRISLTITLAVIFIAAMGIRLYDLTDLPLDFHPARQLFSAFKARGMYYSMLPESADVPAWQRDLAIQQGRESAIIEPPVLEYVVANTYRLFGEHLWIARIYSSLFWLIGGLFLYLLAREIASTDSAVIVLLLYLFLPYGIIASRSFQPDPLMTMFVIAGTWATFNWREKATWKWAVAAGLLNGLAIFIKNVAVFPLLGVAFALILERGLVDSLKDRKTWTVAVLSALPAGLFLIYGTYISGFMTQQFGLRFFPDLWKEAAFYLRWKGQLDGITGFGAVSFALLGIFLARKRSITAMLIGLWGGYIAYGMTFSYHITTHDYYNLPVIPIVALSISVPIAILAEQLSQRNPSIFVRAFLTLGILVVTVTHMWYARVDLAQVDYRQDVDFWWALGEKLGHTNPAIGLTPDYGARLGYWGWQDISSWYYSEDLSLRELAGKEVDLSQRFESQIQGKCYFVVTQFGRFDDQREAQNTLHENYPIYEQTNDYLIFQLAPCSSQ